jgi:hypothetical protein
MSAEAPSVEYLTELAAAARAHPGHDPLATEAHSLAQIATQAERAAQAMRRGHWRKASNLHFGLAGAIDDCAHFFEIQLDPEKTVDSRVEIVDALDKADAKDQWGKLPEPVSIHADCERVRLDLADGSTVEAWFPDPHDPMHAVMGWIWDHHGAEGVFDALAHALVRPGDRRDSHARTEPSD